MFSFISTSAWSPAIIFLAVMLLAWALRLRKLPIPWKALAFGATALGVVSAVAYLVIPMLHDDTETGVAAISAIALRGAPLYPAPDSVQRYALAYGPLAYLARIPAYWLFGETFFAFKLTGVLVFFASLAGLFRICRVYAASGAALVGVGCASLVFLRYIPIEFWGRGDPLMLGAVVLCIWAVERARPWAVLLTLALAVAVLPNIKLTAAVCLLPVLVLVVICRGWKVAASSVILGSLLFCLPYLSPQVSISNYWFVLNAARHHGLNAEFLLRNLQYSALLLVPLLMLIAYRVQRGLRLSTGQWIYLASIAGALLASALVGSKNGAGSYHLLPCVVPIVQLYFWLRSEMPEPKADQPFSRVAIAWVVSLLLFSTTQVRAFAITLRTAGLAREAVAEIRHVKDTHPGTNLEIGVGNTFYDYRVNYEALTTFAGEPFTIGGSAIRDAQFAGIEIPRSTVAYMERCGTPLWLISKGGAPFTAENFYFGPGHPAFSERFRKAFLDHYQKTGSGDLYDVWSCTATRKD